jgi:hypothetical protein
LLGRRAPGAASAVLVVRKQSVLRRHLDDVLLDIIIVAWFS